MGQVAICDLSVQGSVIIQANHARHMIDRRIVGNLDEVRHDDLRILHQKRQLAR